MASIYLIQPKEYIGTGTCKIGMSRKNDLQRPKSYGIGTRFLCIMECQNPFRLEKKIIEKFNDSFNKIKGNEYFCHCGEEDEMIKLFIEIVLEHKIVDRKDEEGKWYLTDSDSDNECLDYLDTGNGYSYDFTHRPGNTIKCKLVNENGDSITIRKNLSNGNLYYDEKNKDGNYTNLCLIDAECVGTNLYKIKELVLTESEKKWVGFNTKTFMFKSIKVFNHLQHYKIFKEIVNHHK